MALLPLVEKGTAPPIAPGYDMLRPMNRFTRRRVELDNCRCPIVEHSQATSLIELSCACKRTVWNSECVFLTKHILHGVFLYNVYTITMPYLNLSTEVSPTMDA